LAFRTNFEFFFGCGTTDEAFGETDQNMTDRIKNLLLIGLFFIIGMLLVRGFYDVSRFHSEFQIVYGLGVYSIPDEELAYFAWFVFFGLLITASLSFGLYQTNAPGRLVQVFESLVRRQTVAVGGLVASVFLLVMLFRFAILQDAAVADDESTYVFIARTLLAGRVVNPLPSDQSFFSNQFIVMNEHGWFGKYPIGHPLILAIGELIGTRLIIGPLMTALSLLFTYFIGKKMFGTKTGVLAALLLSISPHFLLTGATLLSQTTSLLFMLMGLLAAMCFMESRRTVFGVLAGLGFSFNILVRPLPCALFFAAVVAVLIFQRDDLPFIRRLKANARFFIPLVFFGALVAAMMLLINRTQTGGFFKTGYHELHGNNAGLGYVADGRIALSIAAAVLRENLWLFGWPISLLFVGFVARNRYFPLLACLAVAELAYRVIAPKTVVSTTGPVYVTEIVPLLALASASGIAELKKKLEKYGFERGGAAIVSVVAASMVAAALCFWPVHLTNIQSSQKTWRYPYRALAKQHIDKALVFADYMVNPALGISWAYFPPNPSPSMDDDILFVRIPKGANAAAEMDAFHQQRFADRPAFVFRYVGMKPQLVPLAAFAPLRAEGKAP
jgi:hypothetical protein